MINKEQCRAARAYLEWNRAELSERSKISVPALQAFEAGKSSPEIKTLEKLTKTFEAEGIEFLRNGLIHRQDGYKVISGEDCYQELLKDVIASLHAGDELLIWCSDDKMSPNPVNELYRSIRDKGIKMRQLIQEGNSYLMGEIEEYRYLPHNSGGINFVNVVRLSYGDKYAEVNGEESRVVIYRDKRASERDKFLFNVLWENLEQPKESLADEKF